MFYTGSRNSGRILEPVPLSPEEIKQGNPTTAMTRLVARILLKVSISLIFPSASGLSVGFMPRRFRVSSNRRRASCFGAPYPDLFMQGPRAGTWFGML